MKRLLIAALLFATPTNTLADSPVIEHVRVHKTGETWTFDVTLRHGDTGWDHYADGWRILDMDGNQLGIRPLAHPHVAEQPFTRSLSGVKLPVGVSQVQIQARDTADGWSAKMKTVTLR